MRPKIGQGRPTQVAKTTYASPGANAARPGSIEASSLSEVGTKRKQASSAHPADLDAFDAISARQNIVEVGRPFRIDYGSMHIMTSDAAKHLAGGIAPGTFLLAVSSDLDDPEEIILLRVLRPSPLPTDGDMVSTMIAAYKDTRIELDAVTRNQMQFSGLECRVLGSFYSQDGDTQFAGDVDNIYTPSNYIVVKPTGKLLETLINYRPRDANRSGDVRVGKVRYADSQRHGNDEDAEVFLSALDFLGKRTAAFGMTRTGKSNTVKVLIEAIQALPSKGATMEVNGKQLPVEPVGQLIFDINGEYANTNVQDGTSIYEKYSDTTDRYAVQEKPGFTVMKFNFYSHIAEGFALMKGRSGIKASDNSYLGNFYSIEWEDPDALEEGILDKDELISARARYQRQVACYQAMLFAADYPAPRDFKVKFPSNQVLRSSGISAFEVDTAAGITLTQAKNWFEEAWRLHKPVDSETESDDIRGVTYFRDYAKNHGGNEWADVTLKTLMTMLSRTKTPGGSVGINGYLAIRGNKDLHTAVEDESFEKKIVKQLRKGHIVILDLSQGDPVVQQTYSERIATAVFNDAQNLFVTGKDSNYIQMWFEEAQNLFLTDDLTNIYLRLAKEGAKYHLGMGYSTQEVTSIPANIRANTQNWFTSHINNERELSALAGYYDYDDFIGSLRRTARKGFIRMKTDSASYIIPVQLDKFGVGIDR